MDLYNIYRKWQKLQICVIHKTKREFDFQEREVL